MSRKDYKLTTANVKNQSITKDEYQSKALEGMADKILGQDYYECRRCGKGWKQKHKETSPDEVCKRCGEIVGPARK